MVSTTNPGLNEEAPRRSRLTTVRATASEISCPHLSELQFHEGKVYTRTLHSSICGYAGSKVPAFLPYTSSRSDKSTVGALEPLKGCDQVVTEQDMGKIMHVVLQKLAAGVDGGSFLVEWATQAKALEGTMFIDSFAIIRGLDCIVP